MQRGHWATKVLTSRKFYGRHWHSLIDHAGKQSRIISAKSTNTKEEERPSILCKVSPDWPAGDLVTSSPQAWSAFKQNRNLRKLNKAMLLKCRNHRFRNTTALYHHSLTQQYPIALSSTTPKQSISDFIACGEGVWWCQILSGVEFLDGPDEPSTRPQGPKLHHFRSSDP